MLNNCITQIEIYPHEGGVRVYIERQQQFTNPDTGEVHVLNTWRTPIPVEALKDLEPFLSRDGVKLDEKSKQFILEKLLPALKLLGIAPHPDEEKAGELG